MIRNYLKIAWRNLWKHRLFSALNIIGMGVSIAAVGLMSLYIIHELSYDRFHTNADRIVRVVHYANWPGGNLQLAPTSAPFAAALQNDYPEIKKTVRIKPEGGGLITYKDQTVTADDILFADSTIFDVFTFPFLYGDPATALTQPQSIVLTKSLAQKLFGNPAKSLGQTIEFVNHFPNRVTGVIDDVPANSHLPFSALRSLPANYTNGWQNFELYTYLLLNEGSDYKALEAKLPGFYQKYLKREVGELTYRMELQPLTRIHLHSHLDYEISPNRSISTLYTFGVVAILILFMAGVNYINLYTVRAIGRAREVGVRKAIGSRRGQLMGQFLIESMVLASLASLLGFSLAHASMPLFNELAGESLSISQYGRLPTLSVVVLFTLLLGLGSGFYPALLLSGFNPIVALTGRIGNRPASNGFRQSLVVFQFVAAVALLTCSWIIYQQMRFVLQKDLGFNKEQVLTFHLDSDGARKQVQALKNELIKSPYIEAVAAASIPIGNNSIGSNGMFIEQNDGVMPTSTQIVQTFLADADYLNTLQIKLLAGRNFTKSPGDQMGSVLVNETLVKKLGWQQPLGKRVKYFLGKDQTAEATVVGVVHDFHTYSLQHKIEPLVLQMPPPSEKDNLYVRIQPRRISEAIEYIRAVYRTFDPEAGITFRFLDENFVQQYKAEQKQEQILLAFTGMAILIACLGLFGLVTFVAESRTKEIGIRKVLGASVSSIVLLLSKDLIRLVLLAIVIAVPVARYAMTTWLQSFAYKIDIEWWMYALAGIVAIVIALLTVSFQSLKAALVNPVESLRSE